MYRNDGIRKIAIIDFDVHHGNGTEEIIRQLVPNVETTVIRTPFAVGELSNPRYRPWLDETDINDVFFSSTHGYGPRSLELGGELSLVSRKNVTYSMHSSRFCMGSIPLPHRSSPTRWLVLSSIWRISYIRCNFEPFHS
jgi:acetoin utilization deacetylase AcuC-like enzyme